MKYIIYFRGCLGRWSHCVKVGLPIDVYVGRYLAALGDPDAVCLRYDKVAAPVALERVWASLIRSPVPVRSVKPALESVWAKLAV
jgi:hypothetical protein